MLIQLGCKNTSNLRFIVHSSLAFSYARPSHPALVEGHERLLYGSIFMVYGASFDVQDFFEAPGLPAVSTMQ